MGLPISRNAFAVASATSSLCVDSLLIVTVQTPRATNHYKFHTQNNMRLNYLRLVCQKWKSGYTISIPNQQVLVSLFVGQINCQTIALVCGFFSQLIFLAC